MTDDKTLVDAIAMFRRGELTGEAAAAVRSLIDLMEKTAADQKRSADEYQREIRRIDLRCDANLKAIEAQRLAREAESLRLEAERYGCLG
jgi:hypothetical protein